MAGEAQNTQYAIHNTLHEINSTNSYVRIYKPFMQNKPNFGNDKMNINIDMTSNYGILSGWRGQKTKPIQSQFKPNKAKNKPNLTQNKPKTNPIQSHLSIAAAA